MKIFPDDNIWFPHGRDSYQDEASSLVSPQITQDEFKFAWMEMAHEG